MCLCWFGCEKIWVRMGKYWHQEGIEYFLLGGLWFLPRLLLNRVGEQLQATYKRMAQFLPQNFPKLGSCVEDPRETICTWPTFLGGIPRQNPSGPDCYQSARREQEVGKHRGQTLGGEKRRGTVGYERIKNRRWRRAERRKGEFLNPESKREWNRQTQKHREREWTQMHVCVHNHTNVPRAA